MVVDRVGFALPRAPLVGKDDSFEVLELQEQDALANLLGDGSLLLAGCRLIRTVWMTRGWPSRLALAIHGGEVGNIVIKAFKQDFENYELFRKNHLKLAGVTALAERSVFQLMSVQQDLQMLQERDWLLDESFKQHLHNCFRRVCASQVIEDGFNRQKNCNRLANRTATVESSFAALLEHRVTESVHKFDSIPCSGAPIRRLASFPSDLFRAKLRSLPKDLLEMNTYKQKTSWYTTNVAGYARSFVDSSVMEFSVRFGCMASIKDLWLGQLCNHRRKTLLRHSYGSEKSEWYFAIKWIEGSGCLLWPAEQQNMGEHIFFTPVTGRIPTSSFWIPVMDENKWEAWGYAWRSPAWQAQTLGSVFFRSGLAHGVRAFVEGEPMTLTECCAENGFWQLPVTFLRRFCEHRRVAFESDDDEVEILTKLLRAILNLTDMQLVKYLD